MKGNTITFSEADILDGTPLLDIKPYVTHFDSRKKVKNGWIEKHSKNCRIPKKIKTGLKSVNGEHYKYENIS